MKTILLVVITLLLTSCEGCENNPSPRTELGKLPPATQTGKNTFGCLVNGKAFVVWNTSQMAAIYQGGGLSVSGGTEIDGKFQAIEILIAETISSKASFELNNNTNHKGQFYDEDSLCFFYTSPNHKGMVEIAFFDPDEFIVSGTFEFEAFSEDCQDTVMVTEGRFDMQYIP